MPKRLVDKLQKNANIWINSIFLTRSACKTSWDRSRTSGFLEPDL